MNVPSLHVSFEFKQRVNCFQPIRGVAIEVTSSAGRLELANSAQAVIGINPTLVCFTKQNLKKEVNLQALAA